MMSLQRSFDDFSDKDGGSLVLYSFRRFWPVKLAFKTGKSAESSWWFTSSIFGAISTVSRFVRFVTKTASSHCFSRFRFEFWISVTWEPPGSSADLSGSIWTGSAMVVAVSDFLAFYINVISKISHFNQTIRNSPRT